ncbi:hypothetical protein M885DRAFT_543963 [Pelagophyceae sp. CCMP2097]|nr:hypothetical protein M885DRAFT_543963 [Pelagophyceae sp. CCMP2097]|mmetsp:Transcript_3765/g.13229  ORF Transcript_3765/g.13229 Transcript_3765/m.13229 type:complete len:247 (-) Transcript_3765:78-818(-)
MVRAFAFEAPTAQIDWRKISNTNVAQLQRLGDVSALREFLADVVVGDADDGYAAHDAPGPLRAFRVTQLAAQYLLHSQHALARQKAAFDDGARRLAAREKRARKRCAARRDRVRALEDECARQDRTATACHAVLQKVDPQTAALLAQDSTGRIVVLPEPADCDDDGGGDAASTGLGGDSDSDASSASSASSSERTASSSGRASSGRAADRGPATRADTPLSRSLHTLQWRRSDLKPPRDPPRAATP